MKCRAGVWLGLAWVATGSGCADEGDDTAVVSDGGSDDGGSAVDDEVARAELQLALPLPEAERFYMVIGVDHDPDVYEDAETVNCKDYLERSFPHCYDEHHGSDYILVGDWEAMDAGSATIVAAAAGTVVEVVDGNYDRCHGSFSGGTDCDGYPQVANKVAIRHANGQVTWYYHLKKDSIVVQVDQQVAAGEQLGLVGSSGNSAAPHLHLELQDADGTVVDPFAGPLSQEETYWCDQGDPDGLPGGC